MSERRRFLQMVGGSAVALGVGCGSSVGSGNSSGVGGNGTGGTGTGGATPTCESSPAGDKVGKPADYTGDGLHQVQNGGVLIGRDANGLYALSSICTHQGCDLNSSGKISGQGVQCFCHGAVFDANGNPTQGPAHTQLEAYALALGCDGNLYADSNSVVDHAQRLKA